MPPYLRGVRQFNSYNLYGFLAGKTLVLTGKKLWRDYTTKEVKGTRAELTITKDSTHYESKNDEQISNLYAQISVKVPGTVDIEIGSEVEIVDGKATLYGKYNNELSIEASSIRPVAAQPAANGGKQ